jgi:hypothetical protein
MSWSMAAFSRVCAAQIVRRLFSPLIQMKRHSEEARRANSVWGRRQQRWCTNVCISESASHS